MSPNYYICHRFSAHPAIATIRCIISTRVLYDPLNYVVHDKNNEDYVPSSQS